jgi:predicted lactoylglutathione lyase
MEQRLSMITLGVRDVKRARSFYEALGWKSGSEEESDDPTFFQAGCMVVALWDRARLAEDSVVTDSGGWGGMTLAYSVNSEKEVEEVTEQARRAGATIGREPGKTFWGGYDSIFIDPDGHPWEVAYNPRWTVAEDGSLTIPA